MGQAYSVKHLLQHKLEKRSWKDRIWFDDSWKGLSSFCALSAFTVNTLFRRQLFVYEGLISGNLFIMSFSSIFNVYFQWGFLQKPLLKGDIQCGMCALGRGIGVQLATAYLIPGMISFASSAWLADRYKSTHIPRFDVPLTAEFRT